MPATYEPIATTTLSSAAALITFSSISSAYTDLRLVFVLSTSAGQGPNVTFNNDTNTLYSFTYINGAGAGASTGKSTNQDRFTTYWATSYPTTSPAMFTMDLFSYRSSINKTALFSTSMDKNGSGEINRFVGLYRSTSPITSIELISPSGNFTAGSTATLYGILKA
jgi:hypothetical protein